MNIDVPFLGIDFGTTQSSMAWFNPKTGQAEIIRNAEGEEKTPSVVYYGDSEILVGKIALDLLADPQERQRVVTSVKRELGRPKSYCIDNHILRPVEIASLILKKLRIDAEEGHFRSPIKHAVVTHPAVFDQQEIDLLEQAAKMAGFTDVLLIPEPVAAAYAYADAKPDVGNCLLVYDFGGGTFDLAILKRDDIDGTYALAAEPRGFACGGDDLDRALYDHCNSIAKTTLGCQIGSDTQLDLRFLRECQKRKENLSIRQSSDFSSYLADGVLFKYRIERSDFEQLIRSELDATIKLTRALLQEANERGVTPSETILIGGSTQIPLVQQLIKESLNLEPLKWQNRELAVTIGAACHGRATWMNLAHENSISKAHASNGQTLTLATGLGMTVTASPPSNCSPANRHIGIDDEDPFEDDWDEIEEPNNCSPANRHIGIEIDCGFSSPQFITDHLSGAVVLNDCYVAVFENEQVSSMDLQPVIQDICYQNNASLLIISIRFHEDALSLLKKVHVIDRHAFCGIEMRSLHHWIANAVMKDLAAILGADLISAPAQRKGFENLRRVSRVEASSKRTQIWGFTGDRDGIQKQLVDAHKKCGTTNKELTEFSTSRLAILGCFGI